MDDRTTKSTSGARAGIKARDMVKGNILIVDDVPANLRLLSNILTEQGYKVRSVINGQMALMATKAAPPDLILLDINMPEMNGYEVCEQLKADPDVRMRDIPVIFISALDEVDDKVKAFTVGGVDYVTKPFQLEEVLARVETHLALRDLQRELEQINCELEQRVQARTAELVELNAALERFVPHEFLSFLQCESITELKLGDQVQRDMTISFSDIRHFTARSERMSPQESFGFLNAYLARFGPIIRQHNGLVDKYLGDGIMALFSGPADDAVQAAIAAQHEVVAYNVDLQAQGYEPIAVGTGLHTGSLMLGIIGEEQRVQGTVISDAVNLASRLEGLTKMYGVSTVISEQTLDHLQNPERYHFRFLDRVRVSGKTEPVSVFEILDGETEEGIALKLSTKPDFEQGLRLYYDRKFAEASVNFSHVLEQNPADQAARFYLQRSAHFMVHGVPLEWTGVETLDEK